MKKMPEQYQCELCEALYETSKQAEKCERFCKKNHRRKRG